MTPEQKENVKLLIQTLRSGEYLQGRHRLAAVSLDDKEHYCCLGVACEIALKRGLPLKKDSPTNYSNPSCKQIFQFNNEVSLMPPVVMEYYGFTTSDGELPVDDTISANSLSEMNDAGATFQQIATLIEKELNNPKSILFQP